MENLVNIATYSYSRAEMLRIELESAGIECSLSDVNVIRSTIPAAVRIYVREEDAEKAMKIALRIENEYGEDELKAEDIVEDIDKILVPIDFSQYSQNACDYAIGIAEKLKAEVRLLHVCYYDVMPLVSFAEPFTYQMGINQSLNEAKTEAEKKMLEFCQRLKDRISEQKLDEIKISFAVVNGIAEEEIINVAAEFGAGLIVMGTRGHTSKTDAWFGTITSSIIEDSTIPVLAIPETANYQGINKVNIMYVTNFDKSDFKSIHKLMTLVYLFDIKIYCVHIGKGRWGKVLTDNLKEYFDKHYAGYDMEAVVIESDDTLKELDKFAEEKHIDIMALTSHQENFISRLLHPSLARRMLFHARTPLFVFHV